MWKIYKYLTRNVKYDETKNKKNTRNIYGALVENECVCLGYARAFTYLCNVKGIKAITVKNKKHAWNYVRLSSGKWYAIDATWGQNYGEEKKQFLCGIEFLKNENHIPLKENDFNIPELNSDPFCPNEADVKKLKKELKENIKECDNFIKYSDENGIYDEELYKLYSNLKELSDEILSNIRKSLFGSYLNTESFKIKRVQLNNIVKQLNDYNYQD